MFSTRIFGTDSAAPPPPDLVLKSSDALLDVMHSKFSHMSIDHSDAAQVDVFGSSLDRVSIRNMLPTYSATVKGAIESDNQEFVTAIVIRLRKYLSMEKIPNAVDNVLALSILPRVAALLTYSDAPDMLLYELCWVLTNIAAGSTSQTTHLVETPRLIPRLVEIVASHPDCNVQTQALWCLGNIVGDTSDLRRSVIQAGAIGATAQFARQRLINPESGSPLYNENIFATSRIVAWFSSNASRGVDNVEDWPEIMPLLPVLEFLLLYPDADTVSDTAWAIGKILQPLQHMHLAPEPCPITPVTSTLVTNLTRVLTLQGFERSMLSSSIFTRLRQPVLRALVNLSTGDDLHVNQIIGAGVIPLLYELIRVAIPGKLLMHLPELPGTDSSIWAEGPTIPEYLAKDALLVLANIAATKDLKILMIFLHAAPISELWYEILANGVLPGHGNGKLIVGDEMLFPMKLRSKEARLEVELVREAAWGIANITTSRRPELIDQLMSRSSMWTKGHIGLTMDWRTVLIAGLGAGTAAPSKILGLAGAPLLSTSIMRKGQNTETPPLGPGPMARRSARLGTITQSNSNPTTQFLSVREKCADALLNMAVVLVPRGWLPLSHLADIDKVMSYVARSDSVTRSKYAMVRDLVLSGRLSDDYVEHSQRSVDEVMAALEVFSMDSAEIESQQCPPKPATSRNASIRTNVAISLGDSAASLSYPKELGSDNEQMTRGTDFVQTCFNSSLGVREPIAGDINLSPGH